MEAVIKRSASEEAAEALEYLRTGKRKIIIGRKKQIEIPKTKNKIKYLLFGSLMLLFSFCYFLYFEKKYEITGSVHINGNFMKNHQMCFLRRGEEQIESILSDELGNFSIKLREGFYRIYFIKDCPKKYLRPDTSPLAIKVSRNLKNIRIYIPK